MELTTTHKFLLAAGVAVIFGYFIFKPKNIVEQTSPKPAVKKLSQEERSAIINEIVPKESSADGGSATEAGIVDYELINDEELIAIKKVLDASKKSGKDLLHGNEFDEYLKDASGEVLYKQEALDTKTGTLDLGKIKFNLDEKIKDKSGLEAKLAGFGLTLSDMKLAIPALVKVSMITSKSSLEKKMPSGKIKIIDSSKPLMDKGTKLTKVGTSVDAPIGSKLKKDTLSNKKVTPKIFIKRDNGKSIGNKKKYSEFGDNDAAIFQ